MVTATRGLGQFTIHEPSCGRHMKVLPHLAYKPFNWGKIAPERGRSEVGSIQSIIEVCPRTGKKRPFVFELSRCFHWLGNLVRREKIIGIQPLNEFALAKGQSAISCCGRTLIFLRDNRNIL